MAAHKGHKKAGGRAPGVVNKVTADLRHAMGGRAADRGLGRETDCGLVARERGTAEDPGGIWGDRRLMKHADDARLGVDKAERAAKRFDGWR